MDNSENNELQQQPTEETEKVVPEQAETEEEAQEGAPEETAEESEAPEDTDEGQEPEDKPAGRAEARIRKLAAEAKAEREEKEKLSREKAEWQAEREQARRQREEERFAEQRKEEEARLALLDPQERALFESNRRVQTLEYRMQQMELRRIDDQDKAAFHAKASYDETYAKYADQVEDLYQKNISQGINSSREALHSYVLGEQLKKDLATKSTKKKESASKRIDSATAKPASAKGDVAGTKKGKSAEERLSGVLI